MNIRRRLISVTDFCCWASAFLALVCLLVIALLAVSWYCMWNVGNELNYFLGCFLSSSDYCTPPPMGGRDKFDDSAALGFLTLMVSYGFVLLAIVFHGAKKKLLDGAKK